MGRHLDFGIFSITRREKEIIQGIREHLAKVSKTVEDFELLVDSVSKGEAASSERLLNSIFAEETAADDIHRALGLKVAEGAFFGGVREDILDLLEKIDNIADSAKDAARFLSTDASFEREASAILGSQKMRAFVTDLKGAVQALGTLIDGFRSGKKAVLSRVHVVEEYEERADADKDSILKELFAASKGMNPVTVIQLRDFIFVADNIADNAEDASDVILVLIAKGYG
jgi:predicted phosphate transport protein (TIGR00153 family)